MFYHLDMPFASQQIAENTMGSIEMYYVGESTQGYTNKGANVKVRGYTLLSADISKLDLITNAADGSQALVVDIGKTYLRCAGQWREWTGSSAGSGSVGTMKWSHF